MVNLHFIWIVHRMKRHADKARDLNALELALSNLQADELVWIGVSSLLVRDCLLPYLLSILVVNLSDIGDE